MAKRTVRAVTTFGTLGLLISLFSSLLNASEREEQVAREILRQFDQQDIDWKVRMEALTRLVRAGPSVIPSLLEALSEGSSAQRVLAAQVLAISGDPRSGPALERSLRDPWPQVRIYAIQGLSMLGRLDPGEEPYRSLLDTETDWYARRALAWAFERDDGAHSAATIRRELSNYELSQLDTARLDELAPDFSLADAFGRTYRLSDYRGRKSVVLKFFDQPL